MALRFGQLAHAVHEFKRGAKILKSLGLLQVMLLDDAPLAKLRGELLNLFSFKGRDAAAARNTITFSKI